MIVEVLTEDTIRVTVEDDTTAVNVTVAETAAPLVVEVGVQGPPGGMSVAWANVTGKPATFPVASHTHAQSETHESADTDASETSIHHTLGSGDHQAAPGNHTHSFEPANANIQLHIASTSNPHSVTPAQIGAEPAGSVDTHEAAYAHPSLAEKDALAGTSGTPGPANRYVTNNDARLSNTRTPTAHTHTPGDITQDATHKFVTDAQVSSWDSKVNTDDSRLSDDRTPTDHASTHATGSSDALTPSSIGASPSTHDHSTGNGEQVSYNDLSDLPTLGTAAALNVAASGNAATGEVVKGDDTRLSDNRTPSAHVHPATDVTEDATHRFATDTEKSTWNGKQDALGFTAENTANKGAASGYAPLDADSKVPTENLPTFSASFLGLTDTPDAFTGQAGKAVLVNTGETGLVFDVAGTGNGVYVGVDAPTGPTDGQLWWDTDDSTGETASVSWGNVTGTLTDQTDLVSALAGKSDTTHDHDTAYSGISHVHTLASLTSDATHRLVTDTEKSTWNAKAPTASPTFTDTTTTDTLLVNKSSITEGGYNLQVEGMTLLNAPTPNTTSPIRSLTLSATTTNDMSNNFGPIINFAIQDAGGAVPNDIGQIGAVREGADNTGALVFRIFSAGSVNERMRLTSAGALCMSSGATIYNATAAHRLLLTGATDAGVTAGGAIALRSSTDDNNPGGIDFFASNSNVRMTLTSSGNFLVGTTTENTNYKFRIGGGQLIDWDNCTESGIVFSGIKTITSLASHAQISASGWTVLNTATSSAVIGGSFSNRFTVPTGIDCAGSAFGGVFHALRNCQGASANDSGTIGNIYGVHISAGHQNENASATPTSDIICCLNITPTCYTGTVNNMYALYIGNQGGSATVTNKWGIYQQDTNYTNHFNGKVVIGTTNILGTYKLQIAGQSIVDYLTTNTTGMQGVSWLNLKCTGDMTDGFGPGLVFSIQDNTKVLTNIAHISARRNGADDTGNLYFTTYNAGSGGDRMILTNLGLLGLNAIPVTSGANYGKLQIKNDSTCGIFLGNTANSAANVLDWYEEGSFTPTVYGSSTAGTPVYGSVRDGKYTRIGNRVDFNISVSWTSWSVAPSGALRVGTLPFMCTCSSCVSCTIYNNGMVFAAGMIPTAIILSTAQEIILRYSNPATGAVTDITAGADTSVSNLTINGTYFVS